MDAKEIMPGAIVWKKSSHWFHGSPNKYYPLKTQLVVWNCIDPAEHLMFSHELNLISWVLANESQKRPQISSKLATSRYFDAIWALPSGGLYRLKDEWFEIPTPKLGRCTWSIFGCCFCHSCCMVKPVGRTCTVQVSFWYRLWILILYLRIYSYVNICIYIKRCKYTVWFVLYSVSKHTSSPIHGPPLIPGPYVTKRTCT